MKKTKRATMAAKPKGHDVDIRVGLVVHLVSGSPEMTVVDFSVVKEVAWCTWFEGKKLKKGKFDIGSLRTNEWE